MKTILVLHLCTVFAPELNQSPLCLPPEVKTASEADCAKRAKFYNEEFKIPRIWKGESATNEVAMMKPAECRSPKP